MSWFEFWGERHDPGGIGSVDVEDLSSPRRVNPVLTVLRFTLAVGAVIVVPVGAAFSQAPPDPWAGMVAFGVLVVYVALSTVFTPRPDYGNMGWFGGWRTTGSGTRTT
ncbi:MAG: hypothetical protein R3F59_33085 [Myxococcota bacterium]